MSDELRARATWLPPWGSRHGGAVTERAVPVRGIDCAETYLPRNAPLHAVFVPVRGACRILVRICQPMSAVGFRPRKGHRLRPSPSWISSAA